MQTATRPPSADDEVEVADVALTATAALPACIACLAGFGLPIAFFLLGGRSDAPAGVLGITLLILALATWRLAALIYTGELRIVATVHWMMIYISGAVVPLAQVHTGLWPTVVNKDYLAEAQLIILVWAICFEAGQRMRYRPKLSQTLAARARPLNIRRLKLLTAVAIFATCAYIAKLGPASFFASRAEAGEAALAAGIRSADSQVTSAVFGTFATVPIFVCLVAWVVILRRHPEKRTLELRLVKFLLLALNVVVNNPISNSRYWALAVIIGFIFAMPWFTARALRTVIPVGIITALVLFPYSDYFRYSAEDRNVQVVSVAEKISVKDYDQSAMTANGVWYVDQYGHTNGSQLLGVALFAVPRSIWPDKPLDTGVLVGQAVATRIPVGTTNLSSPAWDEVWIDFGMPGVVLVAGLMGWIARRADETFAAVRSSGLITVVSVTLPMIAGFGFILLRGPLLQAMARVAIMALVVWWLRGRFQAGEAEASRGETEVKQPHGI